MTTSTSNTNRMCRVCVQESNDMTNIFDSIEERRICDLIMECAPITIDSKDDLPSLICSSCITKLNIASSFRKLCVQSDEFLKQQLSGVTVKPAIKVVPLTRLGIDSAPHTSNNIQPELVEITEGPFIKIEKQEPVEDDYYIYQDEQVDVLPTQVKIEPSPIVRFLPKDEPDPQTPNNVSSSSHSQPTYSVNSEPPKKKAKGDPLATTNDENTGFSFHFVDTGEPSTEIIDETSLDYCDVCQHQINSTEEDHNLVCKRFLRNCPFCGVRQLKILEFDKHIQDRHIKEFCICNSCKRVFLEHRHFEHHNCDLVDNPIRILDTSSYVCAFCRTSFPNLKALTCHYYSMHYRKYNCMC